VRSWHLPLNRKVGGSLKIWSALLILMVEATVLAGAKARGWFWLGYVVLGLLQVSVCGCLFVVSFFWVFAGGFGWVFFVFFFGVPFVYYMPYAFNNIFNYLLKEILD